MTHVVTARCVDCRYTYCVVECPVSCFYEVKDPHMLVIDPGTCIDCEACVPQCPVNAIYPDHELPSEYADWEAKNAELFETTFHLIDVAHGLVTVRGIGQPHG